MKKILIIFLAIVTTGFFNSCDKDFEEINKTGDNPTFVPSSMLIGTAVRAAMNTIYSTFNGSEIGENWVQHNALTDYNNPDRYRPRVTSLDGVWNQLYYAASQANQMEELAVVEGNTVNQGVAKVIKAYCFLMLTDLYGDVPFSEALTGASAGNFTPTYDSQENVYNGVLAMLDAAMPQLAGSGTIDPNMDILYGGDAAKWNKFAHSLKFRALMRISSKMTDHSELQALVDSKMLFSSNTDEAKLVYTSASPEANPLFETIVDQGRDEHKLSATFVNHMLDFSDPRLPIMAEPIEGETDVYVGKPNGYEQIPLDNFNTADVSGIGALYLEATAPAYLVSYTELLLLQAEAAKEGYISGGDATAQAKYEAAIVNSMTENGVSDYAAYMADTRVAYTAAEALKKIGQQKWIILFCQGFEAWTEWRRTGYPELTMAVDPLDGVSEIPSRLKYESVESSVNGVNYKAAVAAQGPDEFITKIWWLK
ncbi:MAG: SusD/RagB family nutrient-binding outer membrane lipoprotein [Salinivirgaceae bacterium]|nr:SusD/RagB family nutrient-binding outer membrane lipoprotein [Salinivirgaceae bacterium]